MVVGLFIWDLLLVFCGYEKKVGMFGRYMLLFDWCEEFDDVRCRVWLYLGVCGMDVLRGGEDVSDERV